ncbi:MAG: hypothetical protein WC792_04290 [Candidatus Micrarchaeia archaeon]|jgi:hypothetical protein
MPSIRRAVQGLKTLGKSPVERAFYNLHDADLPGQVRAADKIVKIAAEQPAKRDEILKRLVKLLPGNRALDAVSGIAKELAGDNEERPRLRKAFGPALHDAYRAMRDDPKTSADNRAYFAKIFRHLNDRTGLAELTHDPDAKIRAKGLQAIRDQAETSEHPYSVPVLLRHAHDPELLALLKKNIPHLEEREKTRRAVEAFLQEWAPKMGKPIQRGKSLLSPEVGYRDMFEKKGDAEKLREHGLALIKEHYPDYYARHIKRHLK